jgi:hypothetical protein
MGSSPSTDLSSVEQERQPRRHGATVFVHFVVAVPGHALKQVNDPFTSTAAMLGSVTGMAGRFPQAKQSCDCPGTLSKDHMKR